MGRLSASSFAVAAAVLCAGVAAAGEGGAVSVEEAYPGLAGGPLTYARLADLPDGILFRAEGIEITKKEIEAEVAGAQEDVRGQLERNRVLVLERLAERRLILRAAGAGTAGGKDGKDGGREGEKAKVEAWAKEITSGVAVSDAETRAFYEANKDRIGTDFDKAADAVKEMLVEEKKEKLLNEHIRTFGKKMVLEVSRAWMAEQAPKALDNPVDRARRSKKPAAVGFGAAGCCGPDRLAPVMAAVAEEMGEKAVAISVDARAEWALAERYRVRTVPTVIFFGADGREVWRREGGMDRNAIAAKLREIAGR
ncbi:MAG: thioredoxin family protein [Planctomycetota bacterium]|nr:thioredoxin family protein [Planctomycetota bacterium]